MKLLAFDLGSHMGLAYDGADGSPVTLKIVLGGKRPARLGGLQRALAALDLKPDTVIYERPFARGAHATRSLWGTAGIVEAWADTIGAAVVDATPSEIKTFATGSGAASKDMMIAAAQTFGYTGTDEHEADAVCLLMYAHHYITTEKSNAR